MNKKAFTSNYLNYLYIIVPIVLVIIMMITPFFQSIYYSFTNWKGSADYSFVGLKNFRFLFENPHFLKSITNNGIIALFTPVTILVPLLLALLLFQSNNSIINVARRMILLPYALSMTVVGIIFRSILLFDGPLNTILKNIGLGSLAINWLENPTFALISIIMVAFWKDFGLITVIYLAGLSNLNQDTIDAARVDGANKFQEIIHVIVPQLNSIIVFITTLSLISSFKYMFDYVYNITSGGPGFATETIEFLLYNEAFRYFNMGFACALGLIIFIIIVFITLLQIKVMTRRD